MSCIPSSQIVDDFEAALREMKAADLVQGVEKLLHNFVLLIEAMGGDRDQKRLQRLDLADLLGFIRIS